ncbi:MAG: penicillin acylase family protein, partial [Halobacteriota archaeon]
MHPRVPKRVLSVLVAVLLVASSGLGGSYLGLAAPFSGSVYDTIDRSDERVESPYGPATVRYDEYGVPHVEAENEQALYFAVGYVQARDRLFQMDLQRRLISGRLAEAVGERALESDRFHRTLDFESAAEASWTQLRGTDAGAGLDAFSAGVNHYRETQPLAPEFEMLSYRPDEWTPVDTLLVGKQIAWSLSGSFDDVRRATVADRLGEDALDLYPAALDHDTPVVRGESDADATAPRERVTTLDAAGLYDWVDAYDAATGIGSNNWVVSGNHTASGSPLLANDPHLQLTVPALWYEMHLRTPEMETRGATFAGVPFVVVGRTADAAWGVTNVGGDFTDFYTYETHDDAYLYDGRFRPFQTNEETIRVREGDAYRNETLTVRKTVHGPVIERDGVEVAVSWPGFAATNETLGVYLLNHAESVDSIRSALRVWDVPAQNFVAMDRAGDTLFYPAGQYPVRRTDGRVVRGDQVFNGSKGHGAWRGYTPYGHSNWSGFVPFEAIPHLDDPEYVASANQRTVDDPPVYMGSSGTYADPYRGQRIYDRLDARAASDDPMDPEFSRRLQGDVHSVAAEQFVPYALEATDRMSPTAREEAETLREWDFEMRRDSRAALTYRIWVDAFRHETFGDEFEA